MGRFSDRAKKNYRENWPSMLALLGAMIALSLFGPFVGLVVSLAALVFHGYRRRQVQD
jgi:hypothetical protein